MNTHADFQAPATLRPLRDIVAEYDEKKAAIVDTVTAFKSAVRACEVAGSVGGAYGGSVWGRGSPSIYERDVEKALLVSAWKHVYEGLNIGRIAPASDRNRFDRELENPPDFTLDNIRATFGDYLKDPRHHILRGLAEVFCDLDPAYKSHSKVKIGVQGLPKRIILSGVGGEFSYGSHGQEKMRDVCNALNSYRGIPHVGNVDVADMIKAARKNGGDGDWPGGTLKVYGNGNGHLIFERSAMDDINRALSEFYGEVLPDAPEDDAEPDLLRSRDVSKDLAYYPTPRAVLDKVGDSIDGRRPKKVLEPSCGDGRVLDWLAEILPFSQRFGIEVNGPRAAEARAKGHAVQIANFLEVPSDPSFDLIVMNPPFSGQHWKKHLMHARTFLRRYSDEDGWNQTATLVCVLPATAFYDGHLGKVGLVPKDAHTKTTAWRRDAGWHDLPVASFAESGTNVPTGFLVTHGERA